MRNHVSNFLIWELCFLLFHNIVGLCQRKGWSTDLDLEQEECQPDSCVLNIQFEGMTKIYLLLIIHFFQSEIHVWDYHSLGEWRRRRYCSIWWSGKTWYCCQARVKKTRYFLYRMDSLRLSISGYIVGVVGHHSQLKWREPLVEDFGTKEWFDSE